MQKYNQTLRHFENFIEDSKNLPEEQRAQCPWAIPKEFEIRFLEDARVGDRHWKIPWRSVRGVLLIASLPRWVSIS
jgi:hypothetical protein